MLDRFSAGGRPPFGYGRWAFAEFTEVYQMEADFKAKVESEFNKMIERAGAARAPAVQIDSSFTTRLRGLLGKDPRLLGHATITMTMRYAHLSPGGGREYLSALDAPTVHKVAATV